MREHSVHTAPLSEHPLAASTAWLPAPAPRHLKLTGAPPAFGFERCEDVSCRVEPDGTASSCGRLACPSCGCGGTNLATLALLDGGGSMQVSCSCGFAWVRDAQYAQFGPGISLPA